MEELGLGLHMDKGVIFGAKESWVASPMSTLQLQLTQQSQLKQHLFN